MNDRHQWSANDIPDQQGRVVVVTGATSGIGKEAARVLAGKHATVIIAARNVPKAEAVADEIRQEFPEADVAVRELDLTELASVKTFADGMLQDYQKLDVLINNAGIMMCPYSKTADGFEMQMGTNHLGHFALTGWLLPLLKQTPGSRIVVVSSISHKSGGIDLADLNWESRKYDTMRAYGDSKLANLYFTYELVRKLKDSGDNPLVTAAHPGITATELTRHARWMDFLGKFMAQKPKRGALPTLRAGFDPDAQPADYFGPSGFMEIQGQPVKVESSDRSHDAQAAAALWKRSEELTGIVF
ncbi:MAG: oxidoreductase [Gammaproteobacteria bacterium]|nr:oxidoreductase [Gammaproteobacteria bacterium]